jgi:hypothetical protein
VEGSGAVAQIGGVAAGEGGVAIGGDVVQNIVVVGRFLDFAQAEGLIPETPQFTDFNSIESALKGAFDRDQGNDLAIATASAGQILGDMLRAWTPDRPFQTINHRHLLREIAPSIIPKLVEYGYWDAFHEVVEEIELFWRESNNSAHGTYPAEVLWLVSLRDLWETHLKEEKLYGLAFLPSFHSLLNIDMPKHIFILKSDEIITNAYKSSLYREDRDSDFGGMSNSEFRVFVTGLVIDLIRLGTEASIDRCFWKSLVDVLSPEDIQTER